MGTFKAFLVLLTFIVTAFSLPLSTSDSAQVSCFASDPTAPHTDLMVAVHSFCVNNFPMAYNADGLSINTTYDLISGGTASVAVELDAGTTNIDATQCQIYLRSVVADCELDGQSTGGRYNPIETGASLFTVKVDRAPNSTDSTADLVTRDAASGCWVENHQGPNVPTGWALQAVWDFCASMDGRIFHEGDNISNLVNWVVPNIYLTIHATRSLTIWKEGCSNSFAPILLDCSQKGVWEFTGGYVRDALAEYSIDVRDPETKRSIDAAPGDSDVVKRSDLAEIHRDSPSLFNATESANAKFTTTCNSFPWSENPVTLSLGIARLAASYFCIDLQGALLTKGQQKPRSFNDIQPALFANVIADEGAVLSSDDCAASFDTQFKACSWENLYYGGQVDVGPLVYVLEIGPAGFGDKTVDSTTTGTISDKANRDEPAASLVETSALTPESSAASKCDDDGVSVSRVEAYKAAGLLCYQAGDASWASGDGVSHLYQDTHPWITARIVANKPFNTNAFTCVANFASLIEGCISAGSQFSGGSLDSEFAKYSLHLSPGTKRSSNVIAARALPDMCDDGDFVGTGWASSAALSTCAEIVGTTIEKGSSQVRGFLYQDEIDVYVRVTALETVTMTTSLCNEGFNWLIKACTDIANFYGNSGSRYLDVEWTIDLSGEGDPPFPPPSASAAPRAIAARQDPADPPPAKCDDSYWVDTLVAQSAAEGLCDRLSGAHLPEGYIDSATRTFGDYQVFVRLQALQDVVLDEDFCTSGGYGVIISSCTTEEGHFFGSGGYELDGILYAILVEGSSEGKSSALVPRAEEAGIVSPALSARVDDPHSHICNNRTAVNALWAQAAASGFCSKVVGTTLEATTVKSETFTFGQYHLIARAEALKTTLIDYGLCHDQAFGYLISTCSTNGSFYGSYGAVVQGVVWSLQIGQDSKASSAALSSRQAGTPYGGHPMCVPLDGTSVIWYDAFSASVEFCQVLSGTMVRSGFFKSEKYERGDFVVEVQLESEEAKTIDYQFCIEMYDAANTACREYDDYTSGTSLVWEGLTTRVYVESRGSDDALVPRSDDAIHALDVLLPRQATGCLRAESTPIGKQVAVTAIGRFCPQYSGHTIAVNDGFNSTVSTGGIQIAMTVTATGDEPYILYAQYCYAGFLQLLNECSGGQDDGYAKGGTLLTPNAAYSLSMAYV